MKERASLRMVLGGAGAIFVVMMVVAADPDWSRVNWGDAPTWIAGAIALLALIAAWRAGSVARELLEVERKREDRTEDLEVERRESAERAEQADRVAAWNNGDFAILNGSDLPIWDVELTALEPNTSRAVYARPIPLIPPGPHQYGFREGSPPTDIYGDQISAEPWIAPGWEDLQVEIRFRDAAGRLWERDRYGILRKTGRSVYVKVDTTLGDARMNASGTVIQPDRPSSPDQR